MHDHPSSDTTTFAVATSGCKVNQADSEAISEQMHTAGFVQRDFSETADVYIVNTCTVTHLGDRSSRQLISQARRRHPDALLVVTGCYAQLNPKAVAALPGVDVVVGNSGKDSLADAIKEKWENHEHHHPSDANPPSIVGVPLAGTLPPTSTLLPTHTSSPAGTLLPTNTLPRALPILPLDTQHIGSDKSLTIDPT